VRAERGGQGAFAKDAFFGKTRSIARLYASSIAGGYFGSYQVVNLAKFDIFRNELGANSGVNLNRYRLHSPSNFVSNWRGSPDEYKMIV
jgi:hypothetical protein